MDELEVGECRECGGSGCSECKGTGIIYIPRVSEKEAEDRRIGSMMYEGEY